MGAPGILLRHIILTLPYLGICVFDAIQHTNQHSIKLALYLASVVSDCSGFSVGTPSLVYNPRYATSIINIRGGKSDGLLHNRPFGIGCSTGGIGTLRNGMLAVLTATVAHDTNPLPLRQPLS